MRYFSSERQVQQFYDEVKDPLYGYILKRTANKSDASDLFQDCFARFLEHQHRLERKTAKAWLFTVARHLIVKLWRERSHQRDYRVSFEVDSPSEVASNLPSPSEVLVAKEDLNLLNSLLNQLNEKDKDFLLMRYTGGLGQREIAAITGLTEPNVRLRLHRIRSKLHNKLYKKVLDGQQAQNIVPGTR